MYTLVMGEKKPWLVPPIPFPFILFAGTIELLLASDLIDGVPGRLGPVKVIDAGGTGIE